MQEQFSDTTGVQGINNPPPPPAPTPATPPAKNPNPTPGIPTPGTQDYLNYLNNDPFYTQQLAYLNASNALQQQGFGLSGQGLALSGQGLQNQIAAINQQMGINKQKNALTVKGINEQNAYNQLAVTQDLAAREATESGDNAYYHNKVQTATNNQLEAARLDLADYLAGAQAALAQIKVQQGQLGVQQGQLSLQQQQAALDLQQQINAAQLSAFERDVPLYNQTHPVPMPTPTGGP